MLIKVFEAPDQSFQWIDVVDPNGEDLETLHDKYGIRRISLQDCLDPRHPPKFEELPKYTFIILRFFDEKSSHDASTLHDLTNKLAFFIGPKFLITLHRHDHPFMSQIRKNWIKAKANANSTLPDILGRIVQGALNSYSQAFSAYETQLEEFETVIFEESTTTESIQNKFLLKRKAYVFKRVLKMTMDILPKITILSKNNPPLFQDIKENCEISYFEADNILDHVTGLINLTISLASHGTNEVVKILTIFSVYFMPLMLVTSIYGMNFENMPELHWHYGYYIILGFMLLICVGLYFWFRKKGWHR